MRYYRDTEQDTIISEKQLYSEFIEFFAEDGEHTTFEDYIINCTDKNGTLEFIGELI